MKRLLRIIILLCATNVYAQRFQSGDLYFEIEWGEAMTAGVVQDESYKSLTEVIIPSTVEYEGQTYTVTKVGYGAFDGCKSLVFLTIPDGVTRIEDMAFNGCEALITISIPNSVTHIGQLAFQNCTSLTSIVFPNAYPNGSFMFVNTHIVSKFANFPISIISFASFFAFSIQKP